MVRTNQRRPQTLLQGRASGTSPCECPEGASGVKGMCLGPTSQMNEMMRCNVLFCWQLYGEEIKHDDGNGGVLNPARMYITKMTEAITHKS
mmetsp:Transcript_8169/g.13341  ORF Transcript_8169/g.13341 Transcript_8169/m.13341 type:complete len:91 (-) Transcript_8169:208-480(-)